MSQGIATSNLQIARQHFFLPVCGDSAEAGSGGADPPAEGDLRGPTAKCGDERRGYNKTRVSRAGWVSKQTLCFFGGGG